ncbi:MAG: response regulator [Acidimicrobiales bacterium]
MIDGRIQILLVEDNAADVRLLREAMRDVKTPSDLRVASDGEQALAMLQRGAELPDQARADLVLLDLKLPRKGGLELLGDIRADENLRLTPVIVLTTSTSQSDVERAYGLGANCYIVKPVDFEHFRQVVAALDQFWFVCARLPTHRVAKR